MRGAHTLLNRSTLPFPVRSTDLLKEVYCSRFGALLLFYSSMQMASWRVTVISYDIRRTRGLPAAPGSNIQPFPR
jgi:hypothetical protein